MRKKLLTVSAFVAAFATAGFADRGLWLPAVGCIAWVVLLTIKKPHAGTRGKNMIEQENVRNYSSTTSAFWQDHYEFWRD